MELQAILQELSARLGLPEINLNRDGACRLTFDERILVQIQPGDAPGQVEIFGTVAAIPPQAPPSWYAALLEANFLGQGTRGAAFSLDREEQLVYLGRRLDLTRGDAVDLENALRDLVNAIDGWQQALAQIDRTSPPDPLDLTSPAPPLSDYPIRV